MTKPIPRLNELLDDELTNVRAVGRHNPYLYSPQADMGRMMDQVRIIAPQDSTVLLGGETGTGKTHLARLIHELSPRADQPFLVVNCGALSTSLIESEMFGHIKGAFTGADRERTGKFRDVGRGTLLLDDIDALPLALQAKLLRAVEERQFEPVGSNASLPMQARLIVASNRALEQEVTAGRFRSDLYYRLNVVSFVLPPLRHRPWIVTVLATQFLDEYTSRSGRPALRIGAEAIRLLEGYSWPGNIRELRNVIERAVALSPGPEVEPDDLPPVLRPSRLGHGRAGFDPGAAAPGPPLATPAPILPGSLSTDRFGSTAAPRTLARTMEEAEISRIVEVLARHGNNRVRAASELGISRMTLYKKLHKYGMISAAC